MNVTSFIPLITYIILEKENVVKYTLLTLKIQVLLYVFSLKKKCLPQSSYFSGRKLQQSEMWTRFRL